MRSPNNTISRTVEYMADSSGVVNTVFPSLSLSLSQLFLIVTYFNNNNSNNNNNNNSNKQVIAV